MTLAAAAERIPWKTGVITQEKASALDFKDAAAPRFGYSDVVFRLSLVINIKKYRLSIISRNT